MEHLAEPVTLGFFRRQADTESLGICSCGNFLEQAKIRGPTFNQRAYFMLLIERCRLDVYYEWELVIMVE